MVKIIFVCLGNICRSPLAEGIFENYIQSNNLKINILCDSCGTAGYHIGSLPDRRSIKIAEKHGITLNHKGKKLSQDDFERFDFIIAMDKQNYDDIMNMRSKAIGKAQVLMLRDFDPLGKGDVPDPYYGTEDDFKEVYDICARCCSKLFGYIIK